MPFDEPRARTVIVNCRKGGLFTSGPRGRHAPEMDSGDIATAVMAVLYGGNVSSAAPAVEDLLNLRLSLVRVDDPGRPGPFEFQPDEHVAETLREYFEAQGLAVTQDGEELGLPSCPLMFLWTLFSRSGKHVLFDHADTFALETARNDTSFTVTLHKGMRVGVDGYSREGPENSTLQFVFGDRLPPLGRAVRTTRTLHGEALNDLLKTWDPAIERMVDLIEYGGVEIL